VAYHEIQSPHGCGLHISSTSYGSLVLFTAKQGACHNTSLSAETLENGKSLMNRLSLRST